MSRTAEVGDRLLVLVDPDDNGGVDHAPADVVAVHDDSTVTVRAHLASDREPSRLVRGVRVYDTRDGADAALDEHREMLPGAHRHNPGGDKEPWRRSDVYRWVQAAYRRPSSAPAGEAEGRHSAPDA